MKNFNTQNIIVAALALVICLIVIKIIMGIVKKITSRDNINNTLGVFIQSAVRIVLYSVSALVVADILGIPVTSLLAAFSVVGLAVSLSVQNSLSNLAGGLTILATKPFGEKDFVETADTMGTVEQIGLFYTQLKTIDNKKVYIPNSEMSQTRITNYTAEPYRRVDIEITASFEAEVSFVEQKLKEIVQSIPQVLDKSPVPGEEAVFTNVKGYGSSSITYLVRAWVKTSDYWKVYYSFMSAVKPEFDKNGIEMTYDHLNVHMK